jgi:hypothetical protein
MVNSDADQFRKQAKECRQLTARALKPVVKAFWLRLAEDWLKLAQAADKPATVVVLITNSRAVVLTKLEATPSDGTLPKAIVSNLAPGKKTSVKVATDKSCVFNLHGDYADGSSTDSTSVDLSRDKNVNLVE